MDRAVKALYDALAAELEALGAACSACGRCCRFGEFGHQLWLTDVELDYLVARHGERPVSDPTVCPHFADDGRCGAREGRALACRTFHCAVDPVVVEEITGRYLEKLREIAKGRGRELIYAELSELLQERRGAQAGEKPRTS